MSLDIQTELDDRIRSMNWLRNPFGLCQWAEDNVGEPRDCHERPLWYVCNHWSYDESNEIDRQLFYEVVTEYWDRVKALEQAYFYFTYGQFMQFVAPHLDRLETKRFGGMPEGAELADDRMKIPMEHFTGPEFHLPFGRGETPLASHQAWFSELVDIAEDIRDGAEVYISN